MSEQVTKASIIHTMQDRELELESAIAQNPTDEVFGWVESTLCVAITNEAKLRVVTPEKAPSADQLRKLGVNNVKNGAGFYAKRVKRIIMLESALASVRLSLDHFAKMKD